MHGPAHTYLELVSGLELARFGALRHISLTYNTSVTLGPGCFARWRSPTLQYLHVGPDVGEALFDLASFPSLRALSVRPRKDDKALIRNAEERLASGGRALRVLDLSVTYLPVAMVRRLAAALPTTYLRLEGCSDARLFKGEPRDQKALDGHLYKQEWGPALEVADRLLASFEAHRPLVAAGEYEHLLAHRLDALESAARLETDLAKKRALIEAAANWATEVLSRFPSVGDGSFGAWAGWELGLLLARCTLVQAWWLVRRESIDRAADVDAALSRLKLVEEPRFSARFIRERLESRCASLRALATEGRVA
jgi:hypothetical protein